MSVSWLQLQSVMLVFVLALAAKSCATLGCQFLGCSSVVCCVGFCAGCGSVCFFYFGAGVYCASEAVLLWGVNFLVVVVVVQSGVLY